MALLVLPGTAGATTWAVEGDADFGTVAAQASEGDTIEVDPAWTPGNAAVGLLHSVTVRGRGGVASLPPLVVQSDVSITLRDVRFPLAAEYATGQFAGYLQLAGSVQGVGVELATPTANGMVLSQTAVDLEEVTAADFTTGIPLVVGSSPLQVRVADSAFENCAHGATAFTDSDVLITGTTYRSNFAAQAADILLSSGSATIEDGVFEDGQANLAAAIEALDADLTVRRSTFDGYRAQAAAVMVASATHEGSAPVVVLEEVTVTDAVSAEIAGAIALQGAVDVTIDDSEFRDVHVTGSGPSTTAGVIVITGGDLAIHSTLFEDFSGVLGGAVCGLEGAAITVTDSTFSVPTLAEGTPSAGFGGAIAGLDATLYLEGVTFDGMGALYQGGAISAYLGAVELSDSTITGTWAGSRGGALSANGTDVDVLGSTISGVRAVRGGALYLSTGQLRIEDSDLLSNAAEGDGGLMEVRGLDDLVLKHNLFCGNQAGRADVLRIGGALGGGDQWVLNNRFVSNESYSGAALAWRYAVPEEGEPVLSEATTTLDIVNNTFVANDVPWGAVGLWWGHEAEVTNNILTGGAVGVGAYTSDLSIAGGYNLWWTLDEASRGIAVLPAETAVEDDPVFQDADPTACTALHWLRVPSPARNAGDPAILNADGRRSDIGAWGGPFSGLEDHDGDTWLEDGDCDEADTGIHPGATEIWYDGTDQDCDGNDADQDRDGHAHEDHGGDDCDDTDSAVWPGAAETPNDGIDQDCDGVDATLRLEGSGGCGCAAAGGSPGVLALLAASLLVGWRRREWTR